MSADVTEPETGEPEERQLDEDAPASGSAALETTPSKPREPSSAEPHSAEPHSAAPSSAEPSSAEPSSAEPHSAEPHSAAPSSAEPHSAGPAAAPEGSPAAERETNESPPSAGGLGELVDEVEVAADEAPLAAPHTSGARNWKVLAAFAAVVLVLAGNVFWIANRMRHRDVAPDASAAGPATSRASSEPVPEPSATAPAAVHQPFADFDDGTAFEEAKPEKKRPSRAALGSVRDAVSRGCSTSSVAGLSRQIIAQSRCIDPSAFVAVPSRPNLKRSSNVFLYMEATAKDRLLRALDKHPKQTMTVNSALRTVPQQYLLRAWSLKKRCGITLATPPGDSNHESGLALDIAEYGAWRSALEAQGFRWLGKIDKVHFDYRGSGARSRANIDVQAFQQLWNRNHPDDEIPAHGRYTKATEARLERSPAAGFARGASCK